MTSDQNSEFKGSVSAGETTPEKSIWSIIIGVFSAPAEAFAAYNPKPSIIIVLVVAIVLGVLFNVPVAKYQAQMQYDMMSQSTTLPPQVLDQMREGIENPNYASGGIFGAIVQVIMGLIGALIAWGIGSFIMGGDSTFKKIWGVSILGGLIFLVGNLVKLPLMMAKDSMYVSFGLAALFPDKGFTSILYWLLFYFDAFMIWSIIVSGIGYGVVFNISRGKGIWIALITTLIIMGIMMGLALVGMSFAGVEITFF
jgi:hypothetical protein